jgi:predicted DCC family thiol-disulfide oxidoreductase YuxK
MPGPDAPREPEHLVLYDGTCGFCARTVQWILAADARGIVHFAPLQGATAAALRARHPGLPTDEDSVLYVDRSGGTERVYVRSEAIFRIGSTLGGRPAWLGSLRFLPRWLTDLLYRVVARGRHRISRALDSCPLPPASARLRFLP